MSDCDVSQMDEIMAQGYDPERDVRGALVWSISFRTKDGKYHPIRLRYPDFTTYNKVEDDAIEYRNANSNWLLDIDDIWPSRV